jgi:membrane protein YqaA with SNARE-associated domain
LKAFVAKLVALGPLGLLLLGIIDSMGVPLPGAGDALLITVCAQQPHQAVWAVLAAIIGSIVGNIILFRLARKGGEKYLDAQLTGPRAQRFRRWFQHYGLLTVFIPALVPIPLPLKAFVLSAGGLGISFTRFIFCIVTARVIRYTALGYLGLQLGQNALSYLNSHKWQLVGIAAAVLVGCVIAVKVADKRTAISARPV